MSKDFSYQLSSRRPAVVVGVMSLMISGLLHGYLEGRWSSSPSLLAQGTKLSQLPARCGEWEQVNVGSLSEQAQSLLQCYGSLVREYWKPATGERVNVAVLFGPRGPIAVHTPEVCYSSQGTEPIGDRSLQVITQGEREDHFWKVQFHQRDAEAAHLEVWYAWSDGGSWQAAQYPRVWMTDRLYKIQVAGNASKSNDSSSIRSFLNDFLPQLDQEALNAL